MKRSLLTLLIPLFLCGAAAKKVVVPKLALDKINKEYTENIYSYASMDSLQNKVNKFLKDNPDVVVTSITWSTITRTGVQQHQATVRYVTK